MPVFHLVPLISCLIIISYQHLLSVGSDGEVNDSIKKLFVGHRVNGQMTYNSDVGAYCVRLYKQGMWNPIIIDDQLPMLEQSKWTNENRGCAVAHSKECAEIWISIIEKAFAKYYGSYDHLAHGYVHHALRDLTG
jgi:hypothetical protein